MMNLAYAWLIITNFEGGVVVIPMPDMNFCQQQIQSHQQTDQYCIAGYDTRDKILGHEKP